ncbi:MAG: chromosome partitioning protein ParB, partial [candidate division NC10 bacterium]|nr:chromosome partitioning protein ParB [candidate division NC10 bacterium]
VKNFVLARCNPLSRARKSPPTFEQTLEKLTAALEKFDPERIRLEDIARAAVAVVS